MPSRIPSHSSRSRTGRHSPTRRSTASPTRPCSYGDARPEPAAARGAHGGRYRCFPAARAFTSKGYAPRWRSPRGEPFPRRQASCRIDRGAVRRPGAWSLAWDQRVDGPRSRESRRQRCRASRRTAIGSRHQEPPRDSIRRAEAPHRGRPAGHRGGPHPRSHRPGSPPRPPTAKLSRSRPRRQTRIVCQVLCRRDVGLPEHRGDLTDVTRLSVDPPRAPHRC